MLNQKNVAQHWIFFNKLLKKMRNHMGYSLYECSFKYEKSRWNGCLSEGNFFESEIIKVQQGGAVDLKEIEIHGCRKLLKQYKIVEDEYEDEKLIEHTEDDDVLTTHKEIVDIFKNDRKRKINDTKNENLYVDCKFIY